MGLDIRLPIGALFTALGLVLIIYGATSDPAIYARSLGLNVNLGWGCVLLVFGAGMLTVSQRGSKNLKRPGR